MALTPEQITELALAPKRTTTDEGTIEERDLKDVLLANDAITRASAPEVPFWGIRVAQAIPRPTA